jgi:hypothetical protein
VQKAKQLDVGQRVKQVLLWRDAGLSFRVHVIGAEI